MKSYTPPVVGEKPPKVGFFARLNGKVSCVYYEGRDPQENVNALWIEGEGLGGLHRLNALLGVVVEIHVCTPFSVLSF